LDAENQLPNNTSSSRALENADDNEIYAMAELGSQCQPLEISSDSGDSSSEPRRSGRVKRSNQSAGIIAVADRVWLIPAPGESQSSEQEESSKH
jgi:hypothetical protein